MIHLDRMKDSELIKTLGMVLAKSSFIIIFYHAKEDILTFQSQKQGVEGKEVIFKKNMLKALQYRLLLISFISYY